MFNKGDLVYCEYNQQAYLVMGINGFNGKLVCKNLTNLECGSEEIAETALKAYPTTWATYEKDRAIADAILNNR